MLSSVGQEKCSYCWYFGWINVLLSSFEYEKSFITSVPYLIMFLSKQVRVELSYLDPYEDILPEDERHPGNACRTDF